VVVAVVAATVATAPLVATALAVRTPLPSPNPVCCVLPLSFPSSAKKPQASDAKDGLPDVLPASSDGAVLYGAYGWYGPALDFFSLPCKLPIRRTACLTLCPRATDERRVWCVGGTHTQVPHRVGAASPARQVVATGSATEVAEVAAGARRPHQRPAG
jgi:hypothetical protein